MLFNIVDIDHLRALVTSKCIQPPLLWRLNTFLLNWKK